MIEIMVFHTQAQKEMGSLALVSHNRDLFEVKVDGHQPVSHHRFWRLKREVSLPDILADCIMRESLHLNVFLGGRLLNAHCNRIILLKTCLPEPGLKFIPGA